MQHDERPRPEPREPEHGREHDHRVPDEQSRVREADELKGQERLPRRGDQEMPPGSDTSI